MTLIDKNIRMRYDLNAGMIQVEPVRNLPVGDNIDPAHPRRIPIDGAQRVTQLLIVTIPVGIISRVVRRIHGERIEQRTDTGVA